LNWWTNSAGQNSRLARTSLNSRMILRVTSSLKHLRGCDI
jgi:hypothetical protein